MALPRLEIFFNEKGIYHSLAIFNCRNAPSHLPDKIIFSDKYDREILKNKGLLQLDVDLVEGAKISGFLKNITLDCTTPKAAKCEITGGFIYLFPSTPDCRYRLYYQNTSPNQASAHVAHASTHTTQKITGGVHPEFVFRTLAQNHHWVFGAIAELVHNAADATATQLWIDREEPSSLRVKDNGKGMTPTELGTMLQMGHAECTDTGRIGTHGIGFKQGAARIGSEILVITKSRTSSTISIALLSKKHNIHSEILSTPMAVLRTPQFAPDTSYNSEQEYNEAMGIISGVIKMSREYICILASRNWAENESGTAIYISDMTKEGKTNTPELLFMDDDIAHARGKEFSQRRAGLHPKQVPLDYSLRAYCAAMFLEPKMRIYIMSKEIIPIPATAKLTRKSTYQLNTTQGPVSITIGTSEEARDNNLGGLFLYWRNVLIEAWKRTGEYELSATLGMGIVGVAQLDLQVNHTKQKFEEDTHEVFALMEKALNKYQEPKFRNQAQPRLSSADVENADSWIQCTKCDKWRVVPETMVTEYKAKPWLCRDNPDGTKASCETAQDTYDEEDNIILPDINEENGVVEVGSAIDAAFEAAESAYRLDEKVLGHGQHSTVYEGTWVSGGIKVALKKFNKPLIPEQAQKMQKRFRSEVALLKGLSHANIINIYFCCTPHLTIGMELWGDTTLDRLLLNKPTDISLDLTQAELMIQVAFGMQYLHSRNIVHCDLKPMNILVKGGWREILANSANTVKIIDFGLSKVLKTADPSEVTGTTYDLGTVAYMAPERVSKTDTPLDKKAADVYSFGATFLELLRGERLWGSHSSVEIVSKLSNKQLLPALLQPPASTPAPLRALSAECTAVEPKARPSFVDISKRIKDFAEQYSVGPDAFYQRHRSHHVYRVLGPQDVKNIKRQSGVFPKNSDALYSLTSHVMNGSRLETQFISCTANLQWAYYYVHKKYFEAYQSGSNYFPPIARIDLHKVEAPFYDVSKPELFDRFAASPSSRTTAGGKGTRAKNYAQDASELLVDGPIPQEAVDEILQLDPGNKANKSSKKLLTMAQSLWNCADGGFQPFARWAQVLQREFPTAEGEFTTLMEECKITIEKLQHYPTPRLLASSSPSRQLPVIPLGSNTTAPGSSSAPTHSSSTLARPSIDIRPPTPVKRKPGATDTSVRPDKAPKMGPK